MVRESHGLCDGASGDTPIALARVKTWNPGDTLTAADLNAEFNNILNNPTSLINLSAAGDVCIVSSAAAVTRLAIGTATQVLTVSTGLLPMWSAPVLQSYLSGWQITAMTVSSSGTITHSSGIAVDGTNVTAIVNSSAFIGTTTGAFVAGSTQPKLQASPLVASQWYHIYAISSALGGSPDVLYSTSTSPTLPTGFSRSRRIGSFITTSTGGIRQVVQDGDYFLYTTGTVLDASATNPGTAAVTRTLTVPTGVNVWANVNMVLQNTSGGVFPDGYLSALSQPDEQASQTAAPLAQVCEAGNAAGGSLAQGAGWMSIYTNASAQIRSRINQSNANITISIATMGWTDTRGRFV